MVTLKLEVLKTTFKSHVQLSEGLPDSFLHQHGRLAAQTEVLNRGGLVHSHGGVRAWQGIAEFQEPLACEKMNLINYCERHGQ